MTAITFRLRRLDTCRHLVRVLALAFLLPAPAMAQVNGANGKLQIHYINVGQGDAQLIVSPLGQAVLVDSGPATASGCASATGLITYLATAGLTQLDYHIASHYDADHIGCSDVTIARWPVQIAAFDRGTTSLPSTQTYTRYAAAVATKRQTVTVGQVITLDALTATPVRLSVIAFNGNGVSGSLSENDRSIVVLLTFGEFNAAFGGDLAGFTASGNHDVESTIAASVGQVEVYKVHHHGSATSSNTSYLATIHPRIAMLSMGAPNAYDHPTQATLGRLHAVVSQVYWTTAGDGAPMGATDSLSASSIIEVPTGGLTFQVNYGSHHDLYDSWPSDTPLTFTDDPLQPGITPLKVVHFTELRQHIDTLRSRYLLSGFAWTDPTLTAGVTPVKAIHIAELRTALQEAFVAAGRTPPTFTNSVLTANTSRVVATNIAEIRAAVRALW